MVFMKSWKHLVALTAMGSLLVSGTANSSARWAAGVGEPSTNYHLASMEPTPDGGLVFVGSYDVHPTTSDGYAVKLDALGNVSWQFRYDCRQSDSFTDVCVLSDGTYFVTGATATPHVTEYDIWCLLLGPSGNILWQKTYGGAAREAAESGRALPGGGFVVLGTTSSPYPHDLWCLRLDASGNIVWQKTYGSSGWDVKYPRIRPTTDGGFVAAATVYPGSGLDEQIWCIKLDSAGTITWQKTYGSAPGFFMRAIEPALDGGYVMCVGTMALPMDSRIIKLTSTGNVVWQTCVVLDGISNPSLRSVCQTSGGGYVAAGSIKVGGTNDGWMVGLDENGAIIWQKSAGGASANETLAHVKPTADGNLVFGGSTTISSKEIGLTMRTDDTGEVDPSCPVGYTGIAPTYPALSAVAGAGVSNVTALGDAATYVAPIPGAATGRLFCRSPAASDLAGSFGNVKFKRSRLNATVTCMNAGAAAAGSFTVKVYLSTRSTSTRRATLIKTQNIGGLGAFSQSAFSIRATPTTRHKYLLAVVDSSNTVAEDNETNNFVVYKFR